MRTATSLALAAALLSAAPAPVLAQGEQKPAPAAAPAEKAGDKAAEPEAAPETPSVYTYEVGGRRDPMRSLLIRNPGEAHGPRPPGLAGMLVEELDLQGTIKIRTGWVAMMRGGDNRSYLVRKGTTVFDGEVTDITASDVMFRQNVNDPTNPKPFRDVVKSLALQRKGP